MKDSEAFDIETSPKEEENERNEEEGKEEEGKDLASDKLKDKEKNNENENKNTQNNKNEEAIDLFYHNVKDYYYGSKIKKYLIISILFIVFIFFVFFFIFSNKKNDSQLFASEQFKGLQENNYNTINNASNITNINNMANITIITNIVNMTNITNVSNITNITNTIQKENNISNANETMPNLTNINQLNQSNYTINKIIKVKTQKIGVGFYFPKLTEFMVTTGECFVKTGKYDLFFLTNVSEKNELKFDKKIKRIEAYSKKDIMKKMSKNKTIDFLIVSDMLNKKNIKWLKSYGYKLIGVSHNIYKKNKFNKDSNITNIKDFELFDVYINYNINDYNKYKQLGLSNNIIIPNMINMKSKNIRKSNLAFQNIIMLAELTENNIIKQIIMSMALVHKEVPNFQLNIVSQDKPIKELIDLINSFNLTNNIIFSPLDKNISHYLHNTSLFLYGAINDSYQDILIETKMYGIPCIMFSDFSKQFYFQRGVLKLDVNNNKTIVEEICRIMRQRHYRYIIGKEARSSLDFINDDIEMIWYKIFKVLKKGKDGEKKFQELRNKIKDKFK